MSNTVASLVLLAEVFLLWLGFQVPSHMSIREILGKRMLQFWHWSATWKWWDGLFVGAYAVSISIHEYLLALLSLVLCAFSIVSILWHSTGLTTFVKYMGTLFTCTAFVYLSFVTVQEHEDRPWSHVLTLPDLQKHVSVACKLPEDLSPCSLQCAVDNPHNSPTQNVSIGFNGIYPYDTRLAAGTETHMAIRRQETLPQAMSDGFIDKGLQAFSVDVPMIPGKSKFTFSLWTNSDVNRKACSYIISEIRKEQRKKIIKLITENPDRRLNLDAIISLQAKLTSLFVPANFVSQDGARQVQFRSPQEEQLVGVLNSMRIEQGRAVCLIPIFAAEATDGSIQYFANAPPMMTWEFNRESYEQGFGYIKTSPRPPAEYSCREN